MSDIKKLGSYVASKIQTFFDCLSSRYCYEDWLNLSKVTLVSILVLNRKLAGEFERACIEDFKNVERIDTETSSEKYGRFVICGKLGRSVPVLLTLKMEDSVNLILKYRAASKVNPKNPFIFGIPGHDAGRHKHLRACVLLRQYSEECGAEHPERLRGTYLRKQFATLCAASIVNENDIYDIAAFMGHADEIHRIHYRQSVVSRDVCAVSKILENAMGLNTEDEEMNIDSTSTMASSD